MCRKCGEPDRRGNARNRRQRTRALLSGRGAWSHGGNGVITACVWCDVLLWEKRVPGRLAVGGQRLLVLPLERDRVERGTTYAIDSLVAACGPCNRSRDVLLPWPEGCQFGPTELAV